MIVLIIVNLVIFAAITFCQSPDSGKHMRAKVIKLDSGGKDYLRVLGGPPESSKMRAGLVTLAPNKSVGKHGTEKYEELVIVFKGQGKIEITDGDTITFRKGDVIYCPPNTEHDVKNIGTGKLQHLYVVAEAKSN
jgi:quercetin dioxygenase-like cupin family protein